MTQESNGVHWSRLTPDASGDYRNGTWSPLASMRNPRIPRREVAAFIRWSLFPSLSIVILILILMLLPAGGRNGKTEED